MTRHRVHRDNGVGLTELLIAVTIVAIVSTSVVHAMVAFLRNEAATANRLDEGRDLQTLTLWLPADVASSPSSNFDVNTATPSRCSDYQGGGSNVLSLTWTETFNGTSLVVAVSYRVEVSPATRQLVRVSCSGTPRLGPSTVTPIARYLAATPVTVSIANPGVVTLTLTEASGRILKLSATSSNPNRILQ
jgi:prepilin-type N-terminal cleavage/methylation domain-containing protein